MALESESTKKILFSLLLVLFDIACVSTSCKQNGQTLNCISSGLTLIPAIPSDVTVLLLDNNFISSINESAFEGASQLEHLSLMKNSLEKLHPNAFQGLTNLIYLHLGHNKLCLSDDHFHPQLFSPLPNLRTLHIASNKCSFLRGQQYPERAFANLKSVEKLVLSGLNQKLGSGFASMKNLKTLMFIGNHSDMSRIPGDTFEALRNLSVTRLSLRNTNLPYWLSPRLLQPLRHLRYLNLACNPFISFGTIASLINNMAGPSLHTLSVDGCANFGGEVVTNVRVSIFNHPNFQSIKRLSMHQMAIMSTNTAGLRFLVGLETLVLGHVRMSFEPEDDLDHKVGTIFQNSSLRHLALPYFNDPKYARDTFAEEYCFSDDPETEDDLFFRGIDSERFKLLPSSPSPSPSSSALQPGSVCQVPSPSANLPGFQLFASVLFECLPPSIEILSIDHTLMPVVASILQLRINTINKVKYLNLTQLASMTDSLDLGPLSKFSQLMVLEARYCRIKTIGSGLELAYLIELNLDNNDIETVGPVFGGMPSLQVLSLRNNRIAKVQTDVFKGLSRLTHVYLSGNLISNTYFEVYPSPMLLLDLSFNRIPGLDTIFLKAMDRYWQSLTFNVTGNILDCDCKALSLKKWLKITNIKVAGPDLICFDDYGNKNIIVGLSNDLTCLTWFIPLVCILSIALVFVVLIALLYKFRWKVQLTVFMLRRKLKLHFERRKYGFCFMVCGQLCRKRRKRRSPEFIYDAFLTFGDDAYGFVSDEFSERIEDWGVKLFITEREGEWGSSIPQILVDAIDSSRKVICLLTPGFAESEWCDFELKMALDRGNNSVIFVYKEQIPWNIASKTLKKVLIKENFLLYTEDPDGSLFFWAKLKEILMKGVSKGKTSELLSEHQLEIRELNSFAGDRSSVTTIVDVSSEQSPRL